MYSIIFYAIFHLKIPLIRNFHIKFKQISKAKKETIFKSKNV